MAKMASSVTVIRALFRTGELIGLSVGDVGGVGARHEHLAALGQAPVGSVNVVVGHDAVDLFDIQAVGALLTFNEGHGSERRTQRVGIGLDGEGDGETDEE